MTPRLLPLPLAAGLALLTGAVSTRCATRPPAAPGRPDALPAGAVARLPAPPPAPSRLTDYAWATAFSPDGKTLAVAHLNRAVRLYQVPEGRLLRTLGGHTGEVRSVAYSPDGKTLASADLGGPLRLWEAATGKPLRVLPGHHLGSERLAYSPDGKLLASTGLDARARLWDPASGRELRVLRRGGHLLAVAFSPDSKTLVAGASDHAVHLWDVASGRELPPLKGHRGFVEGVAFSPDGRSLASAGLDGTVRLWDLPSRRQLRQLPARGRWVHSVALAPDGRLVAWGELDRGTGRPEVALCEVASGQVIRRFAGQAIHVKTVAFSPDGRLLASGDQEGIVLLWDVTALAGQKRPDKLSPEQLRGLWSDLAGEAPAAQRAVWRLSGAPEQAVPFLTGRLRPTPAEAVRDLKRLLGELDSDDFDTRETASRRLTSLGELARPALLARLADKGLSLEASRRAGEVLDKLLRAGVPPEQLRALRGVQVLEYCRTPQARRTLEALARGAEAVPLTQQARAALARLTRRTAPGS